MLHNPSSHRIVFGLMGVILSGGLMIMPASSDTSSIRSVNEVVPPPKSLGSSQDLRQLENRRPMDWFWQESISESNQKEPNPYKINTHTRPNSANPSQELEDWKRLNQGDPKRDSPGIPLTVF